MFDYQECPHSVYVRGLCGDCGMPMDRPQASSVSMVHSVPGLKVSQEYARKIGDAEQQRLIAEKKLVLLVDLDQTILHTTCVFPDTKHPEIHSFNLPPDQKTFHTKLRPFLEEFLEEMLKLYELHIFTFGSRNYAHKIATIIDPDKKYFGDRILSRDESADQYSKYGNLNNLFPCGDSMVCIIDDRADVWRDAANLIQVKPYSFFKTSISDGTGTPRDALIFSSSSDDDQDAQNLEDLLSDFIDAEGEADSENNKGSESISGESNGTSDSNDVEKKDDVEKDAQDDESKSVEIEVDNDDYLNDLKTILIRIHTKWYEELEREREFLCQGERYKLPCIADIIRKYFRKKYK